MIPNAPCANVMLSGLAMKWMCGLYNYIQY